MHQFWWRSSSWSASTGLPALSCLLSCFLTFLNRGCGTFLRLYSRLRFWKCQRLLMLISDTLKNRNGSSARWCQFWDLRLGSRWLLELLLRMWFAHLLLTVTTTWHCKTFHRWCGVVKSLLLRCILFVVDWNDTFRIDSCKRLRLDLGDLGSDWLRLLSQTFWSRLDHILSSLRLWSHLTDRSCW